MPGEAPSMPVPASTIAGLGDQGPARIGDRFSKQPIERVFYDLPVSLQSSWDFPSIAQALDNHDLGQFAQSGMLAEAMTRDDRVLAVLNTRVLGLLGLPRTIAASNTADRRRGKRVAAEVAEKFDQYAPSEIMATALRWAVPMGFALMEVLWYGDEDGWSFELRPWHPQFVYYRVDLRKYHVITGDGIVEVNPGDGKWFLYAPHGFYRGWMQGAVRGIAQPWIGKLYAFRDWLRYCEVHGLPTRCIMGPTGADEPEKDAMFNSIQTMGTDTTLFLPQGVNESGQSWDFKLVEAQDQSWQTFKNQEEMCEKKIAITILGQNLTTEVSGGSYAAAKVHGQVRQDYLEADARTLAQEFRRQVLRPWAAYNYGDPDLAPMLSWDVTPPDDRTGMATVVAQVAAAITSLAASAPEVDRRALLEQFDIPVLAVEDTPDAAPAAPDAAPGDPPPPDAAPEGEGATSTIPDAETQGAEPVQASKDGPRLPPAAVAAQSYVDDVADLAIAKARNAMTPAIAAVLAAVAKGGSYEEIRKLVKATHRKMSARQMASLVEGAGVMAHLAGRDAVRKESL